MEAAIEAIVAAGNAGGFWVLLSATKDFATEWERLLRPAEGQEGEALALPIMTERFPFVLRSRGILVDEVRMVFVAEPGAVSPSTPVPLTVPRPTPEDVDVSFATVSGLVEGTAAPTPVDLSTTTGSWELQLPPGFLADPDGIHDLWVLVRYHVTNL